MKKSAYLIFILLTIFSVKAQNADGYPDLINEKENYYANYSSDDYKKKYHQEYAFYFKRATTKDNQSQNNKIIKELYPWEIIEKSNPNFFFDQAINSIKVEDFGDDKINVVVTYDLSKEQISEFQLTRGITNKEKLSDLLDVNIVATDITNKNTNKKIELEKSWTKFCCNLIPDNNPTKEKVIYFNAIKSEKTSFKNLSGNLTVKVELPTEYLIKEITKKDIGKIIKIAKNQQIKLIEFVDNKVHFEILNNEELKSEIRFTNVSQNIKSIYMPKYLYNFFRLNPKMKYIEFEKKYQKIVDSDDENLDENNVYVYSFEGNPDSFYIYEVNQKTNLSKEIILKIN